MLFDYFISITIWLFHLTLVIRWYTVKVFLCIINNSIKHWSLVYIQLNDQTILFQTIQFNLFPLSLNVKRNECPRYDTKKSDGEVPVMLELWGMRSTPSLPSLPGSLWPGVVAPDRVLSVGQIELNCVLMLNWIVWNISIYMYKNGFGFNNLQWLMCHKTKPNQT